MAKVSRASTANVYMPVLVALHFSQLDFTLTNPPYKHLYVHFQKHYLLCVSFYCLDPSIVALWQEDKPE